MQATDVYSFGVLMWELYNGCKAWAGLSQPQIMHAVAIAKQRLAFPSGEGALPAHKTYFELAEVRLLVLTWVQSRKLEVQLPVLHLIITYAPGWVCSTS